MTIIVDQDAKLQRLLCHGNQQLLKGQLDGALDHFNQIIDAQIPLSQHRRAYIASAHLGRAGCYIRKGLYDRVDAEIRQASMIYAMDGDSDLATQVKRLSDNYDLALHSGDLSAVEIVEDVHHQTKAMWEKAAWQSVGLLTHIILDVVHHRVPMRPPRRELLRLDDCD